MKKTECSAACILNMQHVLYQDRMLNFQIIFIHHILAFKQVVITQIYRQLDR